VFGTYDGFQATILLAQELHRLQRTLGTRAGFETGMFLYGCAHAAG
jgi:hypothetical protein